MFEKTLWSKMGKQNTKSGGERKDGTSSYNSGQSARDAKMFSSCGEDV